LSAFVGLCLQKGSRGLEDAFRCQGSFYPKTFDERRTNPYFQKNKHAQTVLKDGEFPTFIAWVARYYFFAADKAGRLEDA